jgi:hypothetical protein
MKLLDPARRAGAFVFLLVGASTALAADQPGPKNGTVVVDAHGKRYVIKDEMFADFANQQESIALGAELESDGKTLDVHWVQAKVTRKITLKDGTKLPVGTIVKIYGKHDSTPAEDEDVFTSYKVILPNGKKASLGYGNEYNIDMGVANSPVHSDRLEGIVEQQGNDLVVRRLDGTRVKLVGPSAGVLEGTAGRWVEAYASFYSGGTCEIQQVNGATNKKCDVLRSTAANAKKESMSAGDLADVVRADKPGWYQLRHNWSGTGASAGVAVGFAKRSDVDVTCRWVEMTGTITKATVDNEEVYSIKGANETFKLVEGSSNIGDFLLDKYVGKKITVSGNVVFYPLWSRGGLKLQTVEAVAATDIAKTSDLPAIAKGTKIRLLGRDSGGFVFQLPNGKTGHYQEDNGFSLNALTFVATPGITSVIPTGHP